MGSMSFPLSAWLAALLYGCFFIRMLQIAPASAVLLLGHFGLNGATQFISGIAIEHGGYLSETEQFGSPTGGLHAAGGRVHSLLWNRRLYQRILYPLLGRTG
jgi:hypothetical protein